MLVPKLPKFDETALMEMFPATIPPRRPCYTSLHCTLMETSVVNEIYECPDEKQYIPDVRPPDFSLLFSIFHILHLSTPSPSTLSNRY